MDQASVPVEFLDLLGRLGLAAVVGSVIGFDRELHRKPAGLRTHALVSLGACVFMVIGMLTAVDPTLDLAAPGRVIQGIVAGVGFIGAGAIFRQGDRSMGHGLTTASTIWMVAALGTAAGAGLWRTALAVTVIAVVILLLGDPVDRYMQRRAEESASKARLKQSIERQEK
ncbi:MAG: MgtC/SapB family protein [Acidobacteria bacterium]|nr:MgtC/SapB family protein [Acidobacteriota bacterium]